MKTIAQAIAAGMEIDLSAAGRPVGYTGPRFQPTAWEWLLTDLEADLLAASEAALWEDDGLSCADQLREAIAKAKRSTP